VLAAIYLILQGKLRANSFKAPVSAGLTGFRHIGELRRKEASFAPFA